MTATSEDYIRDDATREFDFDTQRVILKSRLTRKAQVIVTTYGDMDKAAFDRLLAILAEIRNGWDDGPPTELTVADERGRGNG